MKHSNLSNYAIKRLEQRKRSQAIFYLGREGIQLSREDHGKSFKNCR